MAIITLFFQLLPFGCFLGLYWFLGIIPAIQGYLGSIFLQLLAFALMKEIRSNQIIKYSLAISLPALTLYTSNLNFFFSEISIYYFLSGLIISIGMLYNSSHIEKYSDAIKQIDQQKIAFVISAALCFTVSIVNIWVLVSYPLSTWVYFRVFGPLVFIVLLPIVLGGILAFKYNKDIPEVD